MQSAAAASLQFARQHLTRLRRYTANWCRNYRQKHRAGHPNNALTRIARHAGYNQTEIYLETKLTMQQPEFDPQTVREIVRSVLRCEASAIEHLANAMPEHCAQAIDLIYRCEGRVIVTGMGKMSAIARKTAATFCSIGTPAVFLHPSEAHHGDLGIVTSSDVLLALSNSGETRDIVNLVPFMKRHHVPVVSITGSSTNSLAEVSDCHLATGVAVEADSITDAPTNSTTATLALCDGTGGCTSCICVASRPNNLQCFIPVANWGDSLLLRVSDLMSTGDAVPSGPRHGHTA